MYVRLLSSETINTLHVSSHFVGRIYQATAKTPRLLSWDLLSHRLGGWAFRHLCLIIHPLKSSLNQLNFNLILEF